MATTARAEREHDKTLKDSFPASDPPANSGITGAEPSGKPTHKGLTEEHPTEEHPTEEHPTGTPNSDRHATEIAHQRKDEVAPSRR